MGVSPQSPRKQIADRGLFNLIQQTLKASGKAKSQRFEVPRGTPHERVVSRLLSNILLSPVDKEIRQNG